MIINQVVSGGGGSAPAHYVEKVVKNGVLVNGTTMIDLTGATDIGTRALYFAYYGVTFPSNTNIDMGSITSISGGDACNNMFTSARQITNVNLSSLTIISGTSACNYMFSGSPELASVDLGALTTISGYGCCQSMFYNSGLTNIDLSSLATVSGTNACAGMFASCQKLIELKLNALNVITVQLGLSYSTFAGGCKKLESIEFGGLTASTFGSITNQLQYLFDANVGSQAPNGCTVHFPSNFDPSDPSHTFDASTLAGYPTFGGNASYIHVAFDLPATA